ncbi:hypothetical protein BDZ45DRAFT_662993 [Acephala macrosclerotiorum]|nr:hypothetical protein BDZ45DRAFT_662993 [Acephala macrosclerotiorum]
MAGTTTFFDPDGDLRLVVGSELGPAEKRDFVVCSRTLSRATRVLKTMLYGPYREARAAGNSGEEWLVELPEDKPAALKILLYIIHAQYSHVPEQISLNDLYDILVVSQKYDMTHGLRPWAKSWFDPHAQPSKLTSNLRLLGVAWELGDRVVFSGVARMIVIGSEADAEGRLLDSEKVAFEDYQILGPADIIGIMTRSRQQVIKNILQMLGDCIRNLQTSSSRSRRCVKPHQRGDVCDAMTLGSIILFLPSLELQSSWAEAKIESYPQSIEHLLNVIEGIKAVRLFDDHILCDPVPALVKNAKALSLGSLVTEAHTLRLAKQREKTGL